ncbi:MAG: hypothetical protein ABI634_19765, partial [Acidobacteriota bacterium]
AEQTIDTARRSIHGSQLTCGPLCSDERQFPSHPSSTLLAKQTAYLLIRGGDDLVKIMDRVTLRVAEGYTLGADPKARAKFADAAAGIDDYVARTKQLCARGNMPTETEALLVNQAATLRQAVSALTR